jgi:hypothetical protein
MPTQPHPKQSRHAKQAKHPTTTNASSTGAEAMANQTADGGSMQTFETRVDRAMESRGIDLPRERRPGAPMELEPKPVGGAHWTLPERQEQTMEVLTGVGLSLTPVYGQSIPPRGLSGALRRIAYKIPDYRAKHWLLLMIADRVDVQEARLGRIVKSPVAWTLAGAALGAFFYLRRR